MNRMRIVVLAFFFFSSIVISQERSGDGSAKANSQILGALKAEFQKQNPAIGRVELFDVKALFLNPINYPEKPNHYLVVARGVRSDRTYQGKWGDELIGLFLLDDSLCAVKRTVALLPTQHWGDFIVKILKIWKDSVTVRGFDLQSGDTTSFVKKYYLLK